MSGKKTTPQKLSEKIDPIRRSGTFVSRDLENRYRQALLGESFSQAQTILLVNAIGVLVFINSDYRLFGSAHPFPTLLALRVGLCVLSVFLWRRMRSAVQDLHTGRFDQSLFLWTTVVALSQVYVGLTRPSSYTGHFLVHLFTVLLVYAVLPLPLLLQAIPALIMSVGMLLCMVLRPPENGLTATGLYWSLVAGNILGASMSRRLETSKRKQFRAFERETQLRVGLENTLAELKTLHGIIPICAHCKNIRDDAGSWQQLEAYIADHSDAEFSHGICPDCVEKYFKDLVE